jgi:dimethylsulfone monooxygenase
MRYGVWTPLPHTIRPEERMIEAIKILKGAEAEHLTDPSFEFAVDVLRRAEQLGFDVTLIAARQLGPDLEAWTMAAALSAYVKQMELMVAVHPGINSPQMVAKMGASLDRISGGRLSINVVNGWNVDEFNIFGNGAWLTDSNDRYLRMHEYIRILKGLWTEDALEFQGKFYKVERGNLPLKPRQRPNPPIYAASSSPSGKETVAEYCDYWFVPDRGDYHLFTETVAHIEREIADMEQRAKRYGRRIRYGKSAHVICAETVEQANAQADAFVEYGSIARYNKSAMVALNACLVGTAETIADRIRTYQQIGVDLLMLHFHPMIEGMERFVAQVLPRLENMQYSNMHKPSGKLTSRTEARSL